MIAVCPNKECNQRYRIKPEMIGRFAKCKKCNSRFKVEELIYSPKPLELKPLNNESIEHKTKHNTSNKLESETEPESFKAPSHQSSISGSKTSNHAQKQGAGRFEREATTANGEHFESSATQPPVVRRGYETTSKKKVYKSPFIIGIVLLGIVAALFIGNCHVISGSKEGLFIVRRDSIGFSEFFINADEITGVPSVSAQKRFPLGYSVLQREGIIKSDEALKKRTDEERERRLDEAMREAEKEFIRMRRDAQRALGSTK